MDEKFWNAVKMQNYFHIQWANCECIILCISEMHHSVEKYLFM